MGINVVLNGCLEARNFLRGLSKPVSDIHSLLPQETITIIKKLNSHGRISRIEMGDIADRAPGIGPLLVIILNKFRFWPVLN